MPSRKEYEEARDNWDEYDESEKLEFVQTVVDDTMAKYGGDDVETVAGDLEGDAGSYNWDDDTVTIDQDHLSYGEFEDVMDTAYHESGHALTDQLTGYDSKEGAAQEYEEYVHSRPGGDDEQFAEVFAEHEATDELGTTGANENEGGSVSDGGITLEIDPEEFSEWAADAEADGTLATEETDSFWSEIEEWWDSFWGSG